MSNTIDPGLIQNLILKHFEIDSNVTRILNCSTENIIRLVLINDTVPIIEIIPLGFKFLKHDLQILEITTGQIDQLPKDWKMINTMTPDNITMDN